MNLLKIRELAHRAGLSRAALLHYESLGLLTPARRDTNGYRLYGPEQVERLRTIRAYRDAGLSIPSIQSLLANKPDISMQLLKDRLLDIDREINSLREQQITLARLLAQATSELPGKIASKEAWEALMRSAGFTEEDMKRWHAVFESQAPEAHQKFLESLNLSATEVESIRNWSQAGG
ncbi:MAG: MerR family transcriptional regulator [Pseudomonadota bacterium]